MWNFPSIGSAIGAAGVKASLVDRIVAAAKSIVGQKEQPGNSGFKDQKFEQRMKNAGWNKFAAWCVYTVEDIWDNAMGPDHKLLSVTEKLFSGSATATWANFSQSDKFKTGKVPKPGAIVIWQLGKGWQGHAAVVIEVLGGGKFTTVEGNTNASGGREGIEVAKKERKTGEAFKPNGLNLLGFVYPPE